MCVHCSTGVEMLMRLAMVSKFRSAVTFGLAALSLMMRLAPGAPPVLTPASTTVACEGPAAVAGAA